MSFKKAIASCLPSTMVDKIRRLRCGETLSEVFSPSWQRSLTTSFQPQALESLCHAVGYIIGCGVTGHIAEFGTASGTTASVLAKSLAFYSKNWAYSDLAHKIGNRNLYLFDSFDGFPDVTCEMDRASTHVASGVWERGGCKGISANELKKQCRRHLNSDRIKIFEGWFCDTLPRLTDETFALVHIDCDLYESTLQVLDALFGQNRIADGCIILFDDWNCNRASPLFGERRAWSECVERYHIKYSDCGSYGIAGHKFFIHTNV
jgi:O-methyltransferase